MRRDQGERAPQEGLPGLHPVPGRRARRMRQGNAVGGVAAVLDAEHPPDRSGQRRRRQELGDGELSDRNHQGGAKQVELALRASANRPRFRRARARDRRLRAACPGSSGRRRRSRSGRGSPPRSSRGPPRTSGRASGRPSRRRAGRAWAPCRRGPGPRAGDGSAPAGPRRRGLCMRGQRVQAWTARRCLWTWETVGGILSCLGAKKGREIRPACQMRCLLRPLDAG